MSLLLALALAVTGAGTAPAQLAPVPLRLWNVAWQRKLVPPIPLEWQARELGGPAVDPVTGYVVVGTRDGMIRAFDPDGELMWTFEARGRFDAPPRIDRDTVYAGCSDGKLYALALGSGKLRWSYDAHEEVGTTPTVAGDLVLVMTLQDTLVAVDARSGAWKWHHRRETREGFTVRGAAPALAAGDLAVGAYSDGTVAALELATGSVRWERKVAPTGDFMDVDGLRLRGGRLYAAAYSGAIYALDLATGNQLWEARTPSPTRLALGTDVVVALSTTRVLGLSPRDGRIRWSTPILGEPAPSGDPVLVGQLALVPITTGMLWVDVLSGRALRRFNPGTGISAPAAVLGRRVYVLSNAGDLIALDLT